MFTVARVQKRKIQDIHRIFFALFYIFYIMKAIHKLSILPLEPDHLPEGIKSTLNRKKDCRSTYITVLRFLH